MSGLYSSSKGYPKMPSMPNGMPTKAGASSKVPAMSKEPTTPQMPMVPGSGSMYNDGVIAMHDTIPAQSTLPTGLPNAGNASAFTTPKAMPYPYDHSTNQDTYPIPSSQWGARG